MRLQLKLRLESYEPRSVGELGMNTLNAVSHGI